MEKRIELEQEFLRYLMTIIKNTLTRQISREGKYEQSTLYNYFEVLDRYFDSIYAWKEAPANNDFNVSDMV